MALLTVDPHGARALAPASAPVLRRVAYIDHTGQLGGAEVSLLSIVDNLNRTRWDPVAILGGTGRLADRLAALGVMVDTVQMPARLMDQRQADINIASLGLTRLLEAKRYRDQLAAKMDFHGAALIDANSLRSCLLAGFAARRTRLPCVWHVHSVIAAPMMSTFAARLFRGLARVLPDHVICNSRTTALSIRLPSHKVTVIPAGINQGAFLSHGDNHGPRRVGMIARFSPIKGQHIFVKAVEEVARRHPDVEFILAGAALFGEADYERRIRDQVVAIGLSTRVRFLGFVENIAELLASLDVVVSPSLVAEGFGLSVLEAMMAGRPIVASSAGGPADLIDDGVTGRLVPPGDAHALAVAIDEFLSAPTRAKQTGRAAREVASQRFDIRKVVQATEAVYVKVLSKA